MSPEARVFRPRSESEDKLIDSLMKVHTAEGHIQRASWTQYVAMLINSDLSMVRSRYHQRMGKTS